MNSQLCYKVAKEDLARSINSFNINYNNTGLFGVYTECDKEKIPRLMEVVMDVSIRFVFLSLVFGFITRYNH